MLDAIARWRLIALSPGVSDSEIARAEAELGADVPSALADFLRATNGLTDLASRHGYGWDIDRIVSENLRAWSDEAMPLDRDLLSFGDDGAGGWFCLSIVMSEDERVFHWGWIDGEARPVAHDLAAFWESWLGGALTV